MSRSKQIASRCASSANDGMIATINRVLTAIEFDHAALSAGRSALPLFSHLKLSISHSLGET